MSNYHKVADTQHEKNPASLKAYVVGFILSIILTVAAFMLVEKQALTTAYVYVVLTVFAIVQLIVQVICFLRLNISSVQGRWNLVSLLFTIIVVAIVVVGSLWIMYNLSYHMVQ